MIRRKLAILTPSLEQWMRSRVWVSCVGVDVGCASRINGQLELGSLFRAKNALREKGCPERYLQVFSSSSAVLFSSRYYQQISAELVSRVSLVKSSVQQFTAAPSAAVRN